MRVLVDIGHPAHVHFFRNPIRLLKGLGHEIFVTSRDKEIALELLDEINIKHQSLSKQSKGGLYSLGTELIQRNWALHKVIQDFHPDVMAGIGGIFIAQMGLLHRIPSLVFYDTENATLQNALTYPFASCVMVPRCYQSWVPKKRHIHYAGYHELSYLHPDYFSPNRNIALKNGLAETGDTYLIRLVSWQASHDIGEKGWTADLLTKLVEKLSSIGKVLITAEGPLPDKLEGYRYQGKVSEMHHLMAFCRAHIGESATMASESAVLGVPAIYAAETGRGYTTEQEERYGLVINISNIEWSIMEEKINDMLDYPISHWAEARSKLLGDTIDVAQFVTRCITTYPEPLHEYQQTVTNKQ